MNLYREAQDGEASRILKVVPVDGPVYRIERAAKVCAPCEELGILNDDHQGFCWWLVEIGGDDGR